jgi:hypothetical protein
MGARNLCCALTLAAGLLLASAGWAGDGVLEINRACAVNTGCFSGDGPGFPVTIDGTAGKSYRLTGDLDLTALAETTAISIERAYRCCRSGRGPVAAVLLCAPAVLQVNPAPDVWR